MNKPGILRVLVAAAVVAFALPVAASDNFMREMARTDGDVQGDGGTLAIESAKHAAAPTKADIAFLREVAWPEGLGVAEPVETPPGTAVAVR